jgi:ribose transport system substrate-binding protein
MTRRLWLIVTAFLLIASVGTFAGAKGEAATGGIKVGVSNGQITNTWRTQMVSDLNQEFGYYKGKGWADSINIAHAGSDVDLQISQIRNMINSGVQLLLINPLSSTALNPVIEEAVSMDVLVIVFDQEITSKAALQVVPDQEDFIRSIAQYVIDRLDGKGDVVYVSGYDGQPANTLRDNVVYDLVAKNPGINVLTKVNGNWDPTTAQQVMADVLAAFPEIEGVISQDGMQLGIIRAFENANRPLVPITGDSTIEFLAKWRELRDKSGFETLGFINGPGFTANLALGIGIRLLRGEELKAGVMGGPNSNVLKIKLKPINNDNLDQLYEEHLSQRGIADFIDGWYSQEEIDALFK